MLSYGLQIILVNNVIRVKLCSNQQQTLHPVNINFYKKKMHTFSCMGMHKTIFIWYCEWLQQLHLSILKILCFLLYVLKMIDTKPLCTYFSNFNAYCKVESKLNDLCTIISTSTFRKSGKEWKGI